MFHYQGRRIGKQVKGKTFKIPRQPQVSFFMSMRGIGRYLNRIDGLSLNQN